MAPDWARKLASLVTIAVLLGVSAWLRPAHAPARLPAHRLSNVPFQPPAIPGSDRGQTGVRTGSESEYGATQVVGASGLQEMTRDADPAAAKPERQPAVDDLLASAPMTPTDVPVPIEADARPLVDNVEVATTAGPRDPVADAFVTAGRRTGNAFRTGAVHTGSAFRTAGRAIKSIF